MASGNSDLTRRHLLKVSAASACLPGCMAEPPKSTDAADTDPTDTDSVPPDTDEAVTDTDVPLEEDTGLDADTDSSPEPPPEVPFQARDVPEDESVFPIAVMAGAMRETSVLLSTQAAVAQDILVRVWQAGATAGTVVFAFEQMVTPGDGGFMKVPVAGLRPGETWTYGFFLLDDAGSPIARSDIGTIRTAPALGTAPPLVLALSACNGGATGRWQALGRITPYQPDMLLHLGDMVYNDGAYTLSEYRASWRSWMNTPGYRAALSSAGLFFTWDDHEFDNNWNPETIDLTQFDAAYRSCTELLPIETGPEGQIWGSYRWGDTAEIFVLDCRAERRPSTRGDSDAQYISHEQFEWLTQALRDSDAHFKIVMNSVPITNMPPIWDLAADDRWEGYPAQRDALLEWIEDHQIRNVWFVSGDFHVCFMSRIAPLASGLTRDTWEIAVTSGNINPLGASLFHPQFAFNSALPHACILRFDPAADAMTIRFVDPDDGSVAWERTMTQ